MGFGRDAASEVGRQPGTCVAGSTRRECGTNVRDSLAHSRAKLNPVRQCGYFVERRYIRRLRALVDAIKPNKLRV